MNPKRDERKQNRSSKSPTKSSSDQPRRPASFGSEVQQFVQQVESLARATDMTMKTMGEAMDKAAKSFTAFMKAKGVHSVEEDGSESYRIKPEDLTSFKRHQKDLLSCALALRNVPRIFLSSLVHRYDAYLGRFLRVAFYVKPELLNASQRPLTFTELVALSSVEAAREYIIEKEVETVIRDSHAAQFDWMESRFGLQLRKDLPAWQRFVEITERRNLFVHCDGVVSSQYLAVCGKHGVALPDKVKVGAELDVTPDYFSQAVECVLEVGVKLGHVLWRKLQPDKLREADNALHLTTYDVLAEERYSLAKILLHFAVDTLKKQASEEFRCMNLINLAIAHNFSGEREQALSILKSYDWSASEEKYKLAVAVLEHRHADAVRMMKAIGASGSITRVDYSSWPLFKEFRHRPEFLATYRELFGEDFVLPNTDFDEAKQENKTSEPTKASSVPRKARERALRDR
ncbi:MAG: hypothetical protein HW415_129 [Deltaproteobacteria bacterium]|nr:hypothetical protein [Deltaproteobacteria bacterium]